MGMGQLDFRNARFRQPPEGRHPDYAHNLGTTHVLRSFAPLLHDGGRLFVVASRDGSLRALAPVLHPRFENLTKNI